MIRALVSVVIAVYNVLPYLREALDSVIYQTYKNLEIVIVDDGSTDGSDLVCDEYRKDERVKVIHQKNQGLSAARNTGLDHITGEYIAFLDSDDAYYPDMIEKMLEAIIRNNADMTICGFEIYQTEGYLKTAKKKKYVGPQRGAVLTFREALYALLDGTITFTVWNKLYTKKIWENYRFPEKYVFEDIRSMPYVLDKCKRITVIPQALVCYRNRKNSITQTGCKKHIQDRIDAYRLLQKYLGRQEPPISANRIQEFRETILRKTINIWIEMRKQGVPLETINILKDEIYTIKEEACIRKIKTKAAWTTFKLLCSLDMNKMEE